MWTLMMLSALSAGMVCATPRGTEFTYQGLLTEAGHPAEGRYDVQVCLYDAVDAPVELVCAPDFDDVVVQHGVFGVVLDFGRAAFVGEERYLELRVRSGDDTGPYSTLAPRQLIRATPEALRADAASSTPWSGLTGIPAGFADGVDDDSGGTVTRVTAGTGLSGGMITRSGTIAIADGGVGPAQLGNGAVSTNAIQDHAVTREKIASIAVGRAQIAPGAVGLFQIDVTQVQARLMGRCSVGDAIVGVRIDGSLICESIPGVTRIRTIDGAPNQVRGPSALAIGADGLPLISYYVRSAQALRVAHCTDTACASPVQISGIDAPLADDIAIVSSIAIGTDGRPLISYIYGSGRLLKVARCNDVTCANGASIIVLDGPAAEPSMTIGSNGLPLVSYFDANARSLKIARCVDAGCVAPPVIRTIDGSASGVGRSSRATVAADGRPIIVYLDGSDPTDFVLRVAKCVDADCVGPATLAQIDHGSVSEPSIAFGTDQLPLIAYGSGVQNRVKVARCTDAACSGTSIVTVSDATGSPVSGVVSPQIAVGTDGLPLIGCYAFPAAGLKLLRCSSPTCAGPALTNTIDASAAFTGGGASLALDGEGLPSISYIRSLDGSLRFVRCGNRICQ